LAYFCRVRRKIFLTILIALSFTITRGQAKPDISTFPLHVQLKNTQKPIVFYLSGDGGWNTFSQKLTADLFQNGYSVVALDCRSYFWHTKTPEQFATDAQAIIDYYLQAWHKSEFTIVGYSFGADVGVFLPSRISKSLSAKLKTVVLLSPGSSTDFAIRLIDMAGLGGSSVWKYKTAPELGKIQVPVFCIFGDDEDMAFKTNLKESEHIHKITIPGSHHYNSDISEVSHAVIRGLD
jgi:type IV secretory pathway VirJ component